MHEHVWLPTVFVVDDDEAMRDSISCLLESVHLHNRTFGNAKDFLDFCNPRQSGCILLDIRMPGMSGIELLEHLKARGIKMPVIIISGHGDVPLAVRALKLGAFEFLQKPFNAQDMLDHVHAALRLIQQNNLENRKQECLRSNFDSLTGREKEVMELMVAGNSSKAIGMKLGISPRTVDIHRSKIMKKLNIHSVAELVQTRLALRNN